jgi:Fe-S-cluster-containing dehydrogenase component
MTDGQERLWEQRAMSLLEGSEHDTALGLLAARDAQRVVAGEMTEEDFRHRYHDAYVDEFGMDDRPRLADGLDRPQRRETAEQVDDRAGGLLDSSVVISRRKVLGTIGGAAAGVLMFGEMFRRGAFATPADGAPTAAASGSVAAGTGSTTAPVRFGMVIDLELCDGCLICVAACREEMGLSDGVLWPYVFSYVEPDEVDPQFLVRLCQHCSRAPCVMVCPTGARHRRPSDGIVLSDYDVCIGCRYCQVACPYGVNYFQWGDPESYGGSYEGERRDAYGRSVAGDPPKGVMGKCGFCPLRQDDPERRGTSACVDACSMNALHLGDLNDPDSAPRRHLAKRREENGGTLHTFRLLEDLGTEPNIIYIGHPPSRNAELVDGPWSYDDWGLVEDRRHVLEPPQHWFSRIAGGSA